MRVRFAIVAVIISLLILCLCGCDEPVESSDITIGKMNATLPDGDWYYGEEGNTEETQFVGDNCRLTIVKTDSNQYSNYDKSLWFDYYDYDAAEPWIPPEYNFMYIDGYVAEFSSGEDGACVTMKIEYIGEDGYDTEYYHVDAVYTGDKELAKEETKDFLYSIKFEESGKRPYIGWPVDDVNADIKSEIGDQTWEVIVQGVVAKVDHATESNGEPYYIDLDKSYPDSSRVTGIIWEENQSEFGEMDLFALEGKEIVIWGDCTLYDGSLKVRLEKPSQIVPIYDIEDL